MRGVRQLNFIMIAFRIDKRDFSIKSVILPSKKYQKNISDDGRKLEAILEKMRPEDKPKRSDSLFLFETYEEASRFWTIMSNSKFYEVEFNERDVLHIGDMNLTEEMFKNISNDEILEKTAYKYWSSENSIKPRIEILVRKSTVKKIISKSEDDRCKAMLERITV